MFQTTPVGRIKTVLTLSGLIVCVCLAAPVTILAGDEGPSSSDISKRIEYEQAELDASRSELAQLELDIAVREQYLEEQRNELADARMELREAEDRYNATLNLYESRIAAIYKMGKDRFIDVALTSDSFADAGTRISYMLEISENDMKLVRQVRFEAEQVRRIHDRVDQMKQSQARGVDDLRQRQAELEGRISDHEESIDRQMEELAGAEAKEMEKLAPAGSLYDTLTSPALIITNDPPEGLKPSGVVLSGIASWYGPGFHGNHTADGETYDMFAMTAAHKTLPFNTWLKVTYNGRSVFVRVNDRGPYIGGRFLDLSAASARSIGLTGIGYVTAEVYR